MLVTVVRYKGQALVYASFEIAKQAIEQKWFEYEIKWTDEGTYFSVEIIGLHWTEICIVHNTDILDIPTFPLITRS